MYKVFISLALFMLAMVTSCSSQKKLATTASGENPMTFSANGSTVTVKLKGNSSTGYTWDYKVKDDKIAQYKSDEYKTAGNFVGAGGTHTFVFEGIKQGTTLVTFDYAQHWKKGQKAGVRMLMIMVDKDLKVTPAEVKIGGEEEESK